MNFRYLFGYTIKKGVVSIHEENAKVVREVFARFIDGESLADIAHWLNDSGIPPIESGIWTSKKLRAMLRNEKYTGNALLQKTYSNNHLEKKKMHNKGELPMYYVEETHPAIVDMLTFKIANERLDEASRYYAPTTPMSESPFSKKMFCGYCGEYVKRAKNNARTIWHCHLYLERGRVGCKGAKQIRNDMLEALCCEVFGMESFDANFIDRKVEKIMVYDGRLVFMMKDGTSIEKEWKYKSRSASWTPEMREAARQRRLQQGG